MRVLIALILFMFTLSAAYTLNTAEKPTEKLHPAMGSVLQVEKHKPQFISPTLHPDCMLPADHVYEIHTSFKQSCQRYLQYLQFSVRANMPRLLKAIRLSVQNQTAVSTGQYKQGHTLTQKKQKILYTYIIRHIVI